MLFATASQAALERSSRGRMMTWLRTPTRPFSRRQPWKVVALPFFLETGFALPFFLDVFAMIPPSCRGRSAARSGALQNRDRYGHRLWNGPGSAVQRVTLHRVRD